MADPRDDAEPLAEIEALVRAAGNYVRASEDLRPRVLEAARSRSGRRSMQRTLQQAAMLLVLLAGGTALLAPRWLAPLPQEDPATSAALTLSHAEVVAQYGDPGWGMVESFTRLRQRQAKLLRSDL